MRRKIFTFLALPLDFNKISSKMEFIHSSDTGDHMKIELLKS